MLVLGLLLAFLLFLGKSCASRSDMIGCVEPGKLSIVIDGIDLNTYTGTINAIKLQFPVTFMVASNQLAGNPTAMIKAIRTILSSGHAVGVRFNTAYDKSATELKSEQVKEELSRVDKFFLDNFKVQPQHVLFAFGTSEAAFNAAKELKYTPIRYNLDLTDQSINPEVTLSANLVGPEHHSFVVLQNGYTPGQWNKLALVSNASDARKFAIVGLNNCIPAQRPAINTGFIQLSAGNQAASTGANGSTVDPQARAAQAQGPAALTAEEKKNLNAQSTDEDSGSAAPPSRMALNMTPLVGMMIAMLVFLS